MWLYVGACGFAFGILLYSFLSFSWGGIMFLTLLGSVFLFLSRVYTRSLFVGTAIFLFTTMLGAVRTEFTPDKLPSPFVPLLETSVVLEGVVVADPDIRERNQRLTLEVEREGKKTRVLAVAELYPAVRYGERVRVEGKLVRPDPFETETDRVFRYDQFLRKDGIFAIVEFASLQTIGERKGALSHARGAFSDLKFAFINALARALPEPQASLAGGLIAGGKQGLGKELLDAFIVAGLVHIVVLSGYNVMIVADWIMRLFSWLPRRISSTIAGGTIAGFVLAAGAGAASIRAGIMAGLVLVARASDRTYAVFRALLIAGILMLLGNPLVLAFDPGFQLSFLATLGLIFGVPILSPRLPFIKPPFLREIVATTICAQIAVLPLLLYQNGLFSLVALPANVVVLPLVPAAMLASFVASIAGFIVPPLAPLFGFPAYALLSIIIFITEHVARLPLAAVSIPEFPFIWVIIGYTFLGYILYRMKTSHPSIYGGVGLK